MRHARFRHWLLDATLRVTVPGAQRDFFRARKAGDECALESLLGKGKRRELV